MISPALHNFNLSQASRGYLIGIIGTIFWSSTAVFIRVLTDTYAMPPLVLAVWREIFVCLGLAAVFLVVNPALLRLERSHYRFFLAYGLTLAVFNLLWTTSVAYNGASVATVLAYSSAGFTAILGRIIFKEPLGLVKLLVVLLSLAGCVLVSGAYDLSAWQLNPIGILTGLASGVMFAGYSLFGRAAAFRKINPWRALYFSFLSAAIFLLVFNLLPGIGDPGQLFWLGTQWSGWLILLVLALGPTIAGFGLYTLSLSYLPASVANLIATLEPALTALLAYFFLGERLTVIQLFGALMIVVGVIILRLSETPKRSIADHQQQLASE